MVITSKQNPTIKRLLDLREAKGRRASGTFMVDGPREIERVLATQRKIVGVYFCPQYKIDPTHMFNLQVAGIPLTELAPHVFESVAYRENPYGVLAEVACWDTSVAALPAKKPTLVLVAEFIEKPGNLGTLLRSADAVGADALISCDPIIDLFNPNALRASQGAAFTVPYATGAREEVLGWLRANGLQIVATSPAAKQTLWQVDLKKPTALAVGSEAHGLTDEFMAAADVTVSLPMKGIGDSLNVSVASGVMLYEVLRQRS